MPPEAVRILAYCTHAVCKGPPDPLSRCSPPGCIPAGGNPHRCFDGSEARPMVRRGFRLSRIRGCGHTACMDPAQTACSTGTFCCTDHSRRVLQQPVIQSGCHNAIDHSRRVLQQANRPGMLWKKKKPAGRDRGCSSAGPVPAQKARRRSTRSMHRAWGRVFRKPMETACVRHAHRRGRGGMPWRKGRRLPSFSCPPRHPHAGCPIRTAAPRDGYPVQHAHFGTLRPPWHGTAAVRLWPPSGGCPVQWWSVWG